MVSGLRKAVITRAEPKFSWVWDGNTLICTMCYLSGVRWGLNSASLLILLSAVLAPMVEGLFPDV